MKATINGVTIEGTLEEIAALMSAMPSRSARPARLGEHESAYSALSESARANMVRELYLAKLAAGTLNRFDLYLFDRIKPKNGETARNYWTAERIAAVPDEAIAEALAYGISAHGWSRSTASSVYREYRKLSASYVSDNLRAPLIVKSAELPMAEPKPAKAHKALISRK